MRTLQADLARLVGFPSVSNRPLLDLAGHLAERAQSAGFRVEMFEDPTQTGKGTVIASVGPPGTDGLTLTGHMDVVPTEGQPWSSDPFRVVERDGNLYGRGTADMKGFLAACLHATERLRPSDYRKELVLVWTHDEELGCLGSAALVEARLAEKREGWPKACLVGEPTDFRMLRMHPGHVVVHVDLGGAAAHSSRPDLGHNAIYDAGRAISIIERLARELEDQTSDNLPEMERPFVALNLGVVRGGAAVNIVPDSTRLTVGYRPLPGSDPHDVVRTLEDRLRNGHSWRDLSVTVARTTPAMLTPKGTPLETTLRDHASRHECGAATFATDGGNLARLGLEPIIFGPGNIEVAHQADEFIPIDQLERSVGMMESIIRRHCC